MDRRVRIDLAYDGTRFSGWQVQPGRPTVQGAIEEALARIHGVPRVAVRGAGRTDAGVHARGQVADAPVSDRFDDGELLRGLRALAPDFRALAEPTRPGRGVIVTARAQSPAYDFVSRYFAPAAGIDEDPVTGSAHCCLGPYWGERLGKSDLTGYQASARGGTVGVRLEGARVALIGRAVTVTRGEVL